MQNLSGVILGRTVLGFNGGHLHQNQQRPLQRHLLTNAHQLIMSTQQQQQQMQQQMQMQMQMQTQQQHMTTTTTTMPQQSFAAVTSESSFASSSTAAACNVDCSSSNALFSPQHQGHPQPTAASSAQARMAFEVSSVPLSLTM
ncbi:hypothetical protein JZU54_03355, partial [bacterium]|nr:hypothetical protein [bacterium]